MTAKKSKRTISGAPVTKWFITTASVAAMFGGWVVFSSQPSANETDPASQTLTTSMGLEPIPTLVPAPNIPQRVIPDNKASNTSVQTNLSSLRTVSAPQPRPVTVTRSSR